MFESVSICAIVLVGTWVVFVTKCAKLNANFQGEKTLTLEKMANTLKLH